MKSTEVISASDYPFRGTIWPQFNEKRHPESGNRPFQPLTGNLPPVPCPEMALFSNDTGPFSRTRGLVGRMGGPSGKCRVGDPGPGSRGRRSEMKSTEVISASDYPFRGTIWPQFNEKRHPDSGNRPFQPLTGNLPPVPCPEMALFSNNTGPFSRTRGLVDGAGLHGKGTTASHRSGQQPMTAAGPAAGTIRRKMYRRKIRKHAREMNPL